VQVLGLQHRGARQRKAGAGDQRVAFASRCAKCCRRAVSSSCADSGVTSGIKTGLLETLRSRLVDPLGDFVRQMKKMLRVRELAAGRPSGPSFPARFMSSGLRRALRLTMLR
jgi:hypothetical protein